MIDSRRERRIFGLGLVLATSFGFAIRRWPWGRLSLDHFDEGIYAHATQRLTQTGAIDPSLIPYAPPGYAILQALSSLGNGAEPPGNLVSALAGCGSIIIAGLLARSVFGFVGSLVTLWAFCCAGPSIAFARMALTDATFLAAWMVGIAAGSAFVRRPGVGSGLAMGLAVGLAQQVKYNGWLLGAILLLQSTLELFWAPDGRLARTGRLFGYGLIGAGGAALVVFPWYRFVERHGGYAALLQHQRAYLDSPSAWGPNLRCQATQATQLASPWWLTISGAVILLGLLWAAGESPATRTWRSRTKSALVVGLACLGLAVPLTVGLVLIGPLLIDRDPARRLIALSWVVLGVLTPFYHPYARLWLPFEGMSWLLLGSFAARLIEPAKQSEPGKNSRWHSRIGASLLALAVFLTWVSGLPLVGRPRNAEPTLLASSNHLEIAGSKILNMLPQPNPKMLTLARPALAQILGRRVSVATQSGLDQIQDHGDRSAWLLIDEAVLGRSSIEPRDRLAPGIDGWEPATEITVPITLPTALDLDPRASADSLPNSVRIWLYRPRREGSSR